MNKIISAFIAIIAIQNVTSKCSKYGDCERIDMLSTLTVEDLGWASETMCTSIWGWVDNRTDKKYVILSCEPGHSIIDISNPQKPKAIAKIAGENGGNFRWRDVKVYKDHAFMVSDALLSRVQIVDLKMAVGDAEPIEAPTKPPTDKPKTNFPTKKNKSTKKPTKKIPTMEPTSQPTEKPTKKIRTFEPTSQPTNIEEDTYVPTAQPTGQQSTTKEPTSPIESKEGENEYEYVQATDSPTTKFASFLPWRGLRGKKIRHLQDSIYKKDLMDAKLSKVPFVQNEAVNVYTGGGIYQSHNIFINEDSGYAYAVGGGNNCENGLHMIDIRDPKNPIFAGCFADETNPFIHDVQCFSYTKDHLDGKFAGREICYAFAIFQMTAIDVTNKKAPKILSSVTYDGASYVHQGWATTDRHFMIVDDERDSPGEGIKTFIIDIRDPEYLKLSHVHVALGEVFGDHNQYVIKIGQHDYTFQANYAGGLRVLRINRGIVKGIEQVVSLEEVAYFDSNPANHNLMEGVWSVYPFFQEEQLVVMADMDTGFYVLRWEFDDNVSAIQYANGVPTPSPTSWADCKSITDRSKCNNEIACKWDWTWQAIKGWSDGCFFQPGSYKPFQPFRAPVGGAGKCSSLNSAQCNMFPACEKVGSKCRAFNLPSN